MKYLFSVFFLLVSINAFSDWYVSDVPYNETLTDSDQIAQILSSHFPETALDMAAYSLTRMDKIVITKLVGKINIYSWRDDENCTPTNPPPKQIIKSVQVKYTMKGKEYWVNSPSTSTTLPNPCL